MAVAQLDEENLESPPSETIEELFATLESPLLRYALRLVRDTVAAEDIVQDAFLKLHGHFRQIRDHRPWLYRTVHNLALNHNRQADKIVPLVTPGEDNAAASSSPADAQPLPDEQLARWESIGLVRLSLELLDPRSRNLIQLRFHEELSYQQIGERTGLSVSNVGYLLHHALKAIADELAKTGVIP